MQRCNLSKNNFKVLKGGLLDSAVSSRKLFVSAYVTNTRLMGVLGMYIHFKLPDNQALEDLHQFFYFDAEDYGFESYYSVLGSDSEKILELENSVPGISPSSIVFLQKVPLLNSGKTSRGKFCVVKNRAAPKSLPIMRIRK